MRRLLSVLLLVGALVAAGAIAGCGSSAGSGSSSALSSELSYFAPDSPFVMSIVTDPKSSAVRGGESLISKFPIANLGKAALVAKLKQLGIDYGNDLHPLFGNPLVFGLTGSPIHARPSRLFLAVWITKDASALGRIVKKLPLQRRGDYAGATLYSVGRVSIAIKGPTVLLAGSTDSLKAALDRHARGGGITQPAYAAAIAGLPKNALVEAFGNLSSVLSTPKAAKARRVPWIGAIRGYAASLTADSSGVSLDFKVDTSGSSITPDQLPIAAGSTPPGLAGTLPIQVGVRDPSQVLGFIEGAVQSISPSKYAAFLKRQAALHRKTGTDLNSLLRLLNGDLIVESDTHTTIGRVGVSDSAAAARTLAKLMSAPREVFPHANGVTRLPGGFYALGEGSHTVTVGFVGNQLVAGKATIAQLQAFAAATPAPAPDAHGAVAFRVSLPALLQLALKHAPTQLLGSFLGSLGDITGWLRADPSGLTGRATLAIK